MESSDFDVRVWTVFHKYFDFFHDPHFLPRPWMEHFLDHLQVIFDAQAEADAARDEKDSAWSALDISGLLDLMQTEADQWTSAASRVNVARTQAAGERAQLGEEAETLEEMMNGWTP